MLKALLSTPMTASNGIPAPIAELNRMNLLTKPLVAGTPPRPKSATKSVNEVKGIIRPIPRRLSMSRVSASWTMEPAERNASPFIREWLKTWRNVPMIPYAVPVDTPTSI